MRIQELEQHVNNVVAANRVGILSIYSNKEVHVSADDLIKIAQLDYDSIEYFERKNDLKFPYEVYIKINDFIYFALCNSEQILKFGGGLNERIVRGKF